MKNLTNLLSATTLCIAAAAAHASEHEKHTTAPVIAPAEVASQMAAGEIVKVDKDAAKLTIKHDALTHLKMPAMTMAFKVNSLAMLDEVKPGDKVSFVAEKINGAYTVTTLVLGATAPPASGL